MIMKKILIPTLLLFFCGTNYAQPLANEPKNVAIFLYDEVELLDFAGPGEVFSASGFNTYTVSADGLPLKSQRFVPIDPEFSIEDAPEPDIVVFPGGNATPSANNEKVINWIKRLQGKRTQFLSVCTGAFILAKAGLLENKRVTTHWGSTKSLGAQYPNTTVLENTRWVDNAAVITTAGVSAGIDGALHLVARIKGIEAAQGTARYMEYDKWDPKNGVVDMRNEYLRNIVDHGTNGTEKGHSTLNLLQSNLDAPYQGEFINTADELIVHNDYSSAARVIEEGVKLYPDSYALYKRLGIVNKKSGKSAPVEESELIKMLRDGKVDQAIATLERNKKAFPGWKIYSENEWKDAAYYLLLEKKDHEGAIKAFTVNTKEFPNSADTFDSLGEAYLISGNKRQGIENYKIAANMGYPNAKKVLQEIAQ
jgi:transcriptional regulator GlxA family with amidase domain